MIKWPWRAAADQGTLVLGGMPERLLWLHAGSPPGRAGPILGAGVIECPLGDTEAAAQALRALHLPVRQVLAVLPLQRSQWLQIEAPAVPPDELRAAARWRIKELVDGRVDDLTLDVMHVGDGRPRPTHHLFVAAARRALVEDLGRMLMEAGMTLAVVDVAEAAQRNLLAAFAAARGLQSRAVAGLLRHGPHCLLTIGVGDELFYARRLDVDSQALPAGPLPPSPAASGGLEGVDFVDYGAEAEAPVAESGMQRLVIELQRSFDVWERTWTDLPLVGLGLSLGTAGEAAAAAIEADTGLRVERLDPEALFPGFSAAAPADLHDALLPLLGELLRAETARP